MSADVIDIEVARLRLRLRKSLDLNACVEEAQKLRRQAAELTANGRDAEATSSLMSAARLMRHAGCLAAKAKLEGGEKR